MFHRLIVAAWLSVAIFGLARADFYLSPQGSDTNPGSKEQPFKTLEHARDEVRKHGSRHASAPITIWLSAGRYELARTLDLSAEDSGAAAAPIVYRAVEGQEVRITGSRQIPPQAFQPVRDSAILQRLSPAAREKVVQADLRLFNITDFGQVPPEGKRAELIVNDRPLTLAQWPNEEFANVGDLVGDKKKKLKGHGITGSKVGVFTCDGDAPARWKNEKDLWAVGYWAWDWAEAYQRVESIDADRHVITLAKPDHKYGYRKGQRYRVINALAELDSPGEWYLDRASGILYLWPPESLDKASIEFPVLESPLFLLRDTSNIVLRDLIIECGRGAGVEIEGGQDNRVIGCTLRNLGSVGVHIHRGERNGVMACNLERLGGAGIDISAGDRVKLAPAGNFAVNNRIHDFARTKWTYAGGIHLYGVGNRAANNLIYDGPHLAIMFGGNENVMELNEIHDVCKQTGDVGVFYTGRDWTVRGNVIRHNFIHHVHGPGMYGAQGIYLDDCASGSIVFGNVLYDVARGMLIGGGRDNAIENNLIVDCKQSIRFDNRGLGWMKSTVEAGGSMPKLLATIPYREPPWSERYPQLLTLLDDNPGAPKGNVIRNNVLCNSAEMDLAKEVRELSTVADNLSLSGPPGFVAADKLDLRLNDDSPIYKQLPGFKKIPFETIGLRRDEFRKTLENQ